ncbi:MAG: NAD(P)-binding domain-containing protein, partial [Candidatus Gracilibacteria bacterium]|nr:NAD(P)-binding domain-containing protein [Candidatus Gracilibacteria bacterium]
MEKSDIGLIGLAVMGANLARNISGKGFTTLVFNRTVEKMTRYIEEFGNDHLSGKENIEQFVTSLSSPRKIIIMVKAGDPVDEVIQQLIPLLEKNDTVIDCGNSHYHDTIRRSTELQAHG